MKRVLAIVLSGGLTVLVGCSASYSERLEKTLKDMKFLKRLDEFLSPQAGDNFEKMAIFLRPPKPLAPASQFQLSSNPTQYDLEASLIDAKTPGTLRLHVLAR